MTEKQQPQKAMAPTARWACSCSGCAGPGTGWRGIFEQMVCWEFGKDVEEDCPVFADVVERGEHLHRLDRGRVPGHSNTQCPHRGLR